MTEVRVTASRNLVRVGSLSPGDRFESDGEGYIVVKAATPYDSVPTTLSGFTTPVMRLTDNIITRYRDDAMVNPESNHVNFGDVEAGTVVKKKDNDTVWMKAKGCAINLNTYSTCYPANLTLVEVLGKVEVV